MSYFIIIRGPLGIGKSSVAKELSKILNAEYISMDLILEKHGLAKVNSDYVVEDFLKANEIVLPQIKKFLGKGKIVIVDGNFYFKKQLEHLMKNIKSPTFVFTLKASLKECITRDQSRKQKYGEEATKTVYALVSKFDYGKIINTQNKSEKEVVRDILSYLPKP